MGLLVMILGLVLFLGVHMLPAQRELRARMIGSVGEGGRRQPRPVERRGRGRSDDSDQAGQAGWQQRMGSLPAGGSVVGLGGGWPATAGSTLCESIRDTQRDNARIERQSIAAACSVRQ